MFRDLRVWLWVIFKNYFQVDECQANEKQKLPPAHTQKGPCGFLSTTTVPTAGHNKGDRLSGGIIDLQAASSISLAVAENPYEHLETLLRYCEPDTMSLVFLWEDFLEITERF